MSPRVGVGAWGGGAELRAQDGVMLLRPGRGCNRGIPAWRAAPPRIRPRGFQPDQRVGLERGAVGRPVRVRRQPRDHPAVPQSSWPGAVGLLLALLTPALSGSGLRGHGVSGRRQRVCGSVVYVATLVGAGRLVAPGRRSSPSRQRGPAPSGSMASACGPWPSRRSPSCMPSSVGRGLMQVSGVFKKDKGGGGAGEL